MKTSDWLNFFKENKEIKIFHIRHLYLITKIQVHSLRVELMRLVKKGILKRICKGYYANPFNPPSIEEIATQIYYPSYISLESALSYWGILSQMPRILTMVTIKLPYKMKTGFGIIEYRQIKKEYFWGFIRKDNYFIAEKEKALADYIYFNRNICDFSEFHLEDIKKKKFESYVKKMKIEESEVKKWIMYL